MIPEMPRGRPGRTGLHDFMSNLMIAHADAAGHAFPPQDTAGPQVRDGGSPMSAGTHGAAGGAC